MKDTLTSILLALALLALAALAVAVDDSFNARKSDPSYIPPYIHHPQGNE